MFIEPAKRKSGGGFTLLEISFAVAILAMMSLAIYRFVESNLTSMRVSWEEMSIDARYDGLRDLLGLEWRSLPSGEGRLTGEPFKFDNRSQDQINWVCGSGPGLLTRYAAGEYQVTLRMRPSSKQKNQQDIGIVRKPEASDSNDDETWIPLLENVKSLEIRYFDPRLNSWVDRWTDTVTLPRLVKLTIDRPDSAAPWEVIIALGRTPL